MPLLISLTSSFVADEAVVAQFEERQWTLSPGDGASITFRYRLHRPESIDSGKRYPLLVWLHGARERGNENQAQLRWMELVFETAPPAEIDYYILAAQCPPGTGDWFTKLETDYSRDMIDVAIEILDEVLDKATVVL